VNITGLVKYVGRIGSGGGSVFVGLKLDQPGMPVFLKKEPFLPVLSVRSRYVPRCKSQKFYPSVITFKMNHSNPVKKLSLAKKRVFFVFNYDLSTIWASVFEGG